jgi:hypothetical protein
MGIRETRKQRAEQSAAIEDQLEAAFGPLSARPEFVQRLKSRLVTDPEIILEEHRGKATVFVIVAMGLFSGALIVWLVFALRSLIRRRR